MNLNLYSMRFNLEERALHLLLLKSDMTSNLGLLSGKMGICLFFINYSIEKKQMIFREYAFYLLNKIVEGIHDNMPLGLDSGLTGIGWGIEYLLSNKLVEGSGVDICETLDCKLMQTDPRRINDLSFETGLEGILHYVLIHIQGAIVKNTVLPFDKLYYNDLYQAVCAIPLSKLNNRMKGLVKNYKDFYEGKIGIYYQINLLAFIGKAEVDGDNIATFPIGLKNGLAGYMFNPHADL